MTSHFYQPASQFFTLGWRRPWFLLARYLVLHWSCRRAVKESVAQAADEASETPFLLPPCRTARDTPQFDRTNRQGAQHRFRVLDKSSRGAFSAARTAQRFQRRTVLCSRRDDVFPTLALVCVQIRPSTLPPSDANAPRRQTAPPNRCARWPREPACRTPDPRRSHAPPRRSVQHRSGFRPQSIGRVLL